MKTFKQNLGKVSITIDKNPWDDSKCYDRLVVVRPEGEFKTYISRKPVPEGIELSNIDYWLPFTALDESYVDALEALIANKLNIDGSNAQNFELDYFGANRIYRQSQGQETPGFGIIIPTISNDAETFLISSDRESWVHSASYDSNSKRINFYGNLNNVLCYIDATDFIKDGMIDNVYIVNGKLIITFNTEAGKEDIEIPLTDIFNPNNYYTKVEVDSKLSLKQAVINALNKLNADLVDDENATHKFVTATEKTTWNGKQDNLVSGTNIKTINGQSVLGSGNLDVKNIFIVEYNVTTYQQVLDAYNAGKYLILKYTPYTQSDSWRFLPLEQVVTYTDGALVGTYAFVFATIENDSSIWIVIDSSTRVKYSINLQQRLTFDNVPTASSDNPVKSSGIKTALDNKQDKIDSTHKLKADYVDDTTTTHKFITTAERTLWNTVTDKAPLPFVVTCGIDPSDVSFVNSTLDEIWAAYQNGKKIRVKFAKAGGVSFEDDATLLLDGSRNCVVHTVHNGTHYTITIYEDNNVTKLSYAETHDSDKQDTLVSGTNIKTINNASILGSGNLDVKDVFIAKYGVTTYQQVLDAYNAGKIIVVNRNNGANLYTLNSYATNIFRFNRLSYASTSMSYCVINNSNAWSGMDVTAEDIDNKATNFTTLNNTKYPTTKAVADYAHPKIDSTHKLDADLVDDTNSTRKFVTITFRQF